FDSNIQSRSRRWLENPEFLFRAQEIHVSGIGNSLDVGSKFCNLGDQGVARLAPRCLGTREQIIQFFDVTSRWVVTLQDNSGDRGCVPVAQLESRLQPSHNLAM